MPSLRTGFQGDHTLVCIYKSGKIFEMTLMDSLDGYIQCPIIWIYI